MSNFITTLQGDVQHRNALLEKANGLLDHAQATIQSVYRWSEYFTWGKYGRTVKMYGLPSKPAWWQRRTLLVECQPADDFMPGHLAMTIYTPRCGMHDLVNVVNINDKLSIEQHIREAVVDWHTVGKYK